MTALISGSNGLDPERLSIVLIVADPSCLLHTDSDNRTPFLLCIKIEELTPEALDMVSVVLDACPEAAGVRGGLRRRR
jgi:hypothetical protein